MSGTTRFLLVHSRILFLLFLSLTVVKPSCSFILKTLLPRNRCGGGGGGGVRSNKVNTYSINNCKSSSSTSTSSTLVTLMISRRSQILEPHHAEEILFSSNIGIYGEYEHLFNKFVQCVCSAMCIPRKEMYEAWSTALIINKYYPNQNRICDIACGHGLLSWSLLLLSQADNKEKGLTAVCIDKRMPRSAEKVAEAMLQYWPELKWRWDYVETKLENIIPASTTLLCGIHACGILTDYIMSMAMDCNAPVALIPCCHSKKSLKVLNLSGDDTCSNPLSSGDLSSAENTPFSDYIDELRIKRLLASNYTVLREEIPEEYTPKNKMILAFPPLKHLPEQRRRRIKQPPIYSVPVGDDDVSKQTVRTLSGRKAADERKAPRPPSLCVSMFMPEESTANPDILHSYVNEIWDADKKVQVQVGYSDNGPFLHPNGYYARTFSITYEKEDFKPIDKKRAKELHDEFCKKIPSFVEGISIRR